MGGGGARTLAGDELFVGPDGAPVGAPIEREGPARQGFARIPLALAVVEHAVGREAFAQAADQAVGEAALGGADGAGIPLVGLEVVDGDEGGLAAHGEAHVVFGENGVDLVAEGIEAVPALVGEGLGDARVFGDARHLHVEGEVDLGIGGEAEMGAALR